MVFNFTVILAATIAVVGVVELLKNFLPENINGKILAVISLVLSAVAGVGMSLVLGDKAPLNVVANTAAVVGLVQTSYNFILKLFLNKIEELKTRISE